MTSADRSTFDPCAHGFVLLRDHRPPGGVRFYEFLNHTCVDGRVDYHRLNLYLSQDGQFVTIWWGCLEGVFIEELFRDTGVAAGPDYDEPLFRGHIESQEQARHILRALRPADRGPQVLRRNAAQGLACVPLADKP